ncbi:hypothetical protein AB0D67_26600 [Streptosporangium sp. NPDC048047]|uniref:hypothetical protein n=1 Tax=Streptosporangium sp. NPDC048047 TaxID=3155748 RepID=UPI003445533E
MLMLRLAHTLRMMRARTLTSHLPATSLEYLYVHFGREILARAATDRALSDAIAREVAVIDETLRREGDRPGPVELRSFLMGYGQGVIDSAVIRPDLVAQDTSCEGPYPSSVVRLGALSQKAFADGLLRLRPGV